MQFANDPLLLLGDLQLFSDLFPADQLQGTSGPSLSTKTTKTTETTATLTRLASLLTSLATLTFLLLGFGNRSRQQ